MNILPAVTAGGFGKRLFPLSTGQLPKQFIQLFNRRHSSFQKTISRVRSIFKMEKVVICCNKRHIGIVKEQLKEIDENNYILVIEQEVKNTFATILLILNLISYINNIDVIFVLPSDSFIENESCFSSNASDASLYSFFSKKHVLFGIKPVKAKIEYGYIQVNNNEYDVFNENVFYKIRNFIEKPNKDKAKRLIKNSNCFWNSGHFVLNKDTLLQEIEKEQPEYLRKLNQGLLSKIYTNCFITNENFTKLQNKQFDKAIIEKSKQLICIKANFDWLDIGSFEAIEELIIANKISIPAEFYQKDNFLRIFLRSESSL